MVTAYWLNDVLSNKRLFAPKIPLHLPVPFREKVSRCRNMVRTFYILTFLQSRDKPMLSLKNKMYILLSFFSDYFSDWF